MSNEQKMLSGRFSYTKEEVEMLLRGLWEIGEWDSELEKEFRRLYVEAWGEEELERLFEKEEGLLDEDGGDQNG